MGTYRPEGYEMRAANGYHYRKVNGKWKLLHHIIAEERLGRPIDTTSERVIFLDKNCDNLDPSNIVVKEKRGGKIQRIAVLEQRIARLQEELAELKGLN